MLKPFLPQLQTTFVKALNDASRPVRLKAAEATSQLIVIHMRVDPVFTELNNGVKNYADEGSVRYADADAHYLVIIQCNHLNDGEAGTSNC